MQKTCQHAKAVDVLALLIPMLNFHDHTIHYVALFAEKQQLSLLILENVLQIFHNTKKIIKK